MILIDAYSQIFRSYHAVRSLSNSRGEPTNALLPFTKLLLKLDHDFRDPLGAMVFDCGKVQFRLKLCPEYKGNRPHMPDDLKRQIPVLRELSAAFGWPILEEPEYEADDLIAALALAAVEPVRIVSSDKDLSQLVDRRVSILLPGRDGSGWEIRDEAGVMKKFSVPPSAIVDYLSLLGDASDNIAGVKGVGAKTAAEWLRLGSVDDLLEHPEKIANPRLREQLLKSADVLARNRRLIRLRTDLPARLSPVSAVCGRRTPDWKKVIEICRRMELHGLLRQLKDLHRCGGSDEDELPLFDSPGPEPARTPEPEQGDLFRDL